MEGQSISSPFRLIHNGQTKTSLAMLPVHLMRDHHYLNRKKALKVGHIILFQDCPSSTPL